MFFLLFYLVIVRKRVLIFLNESNSRRTLKVNFLHNPSYDLVLQAQNPKSLKGLARQPTDGLDSQAALQIRVTQTRD